MLIERPQGIATPFAQPTGLKANVAELQQKNADFYRSILPENAGLFQPAKNESTTSKLTLDNILFHRDDQVNHVPNIGRTAMESTTTKPAVQYSFRQPQNSAAIQRQNQIEAREKLSQQLEDQGASILGQRAPSSVRLGAPPRISISATKLGGHPGYQYRVPAPSFLFQ